MRLVTRRTGLSPDVLRVWERRYGVVKPARSAGGQRLYSASDIERLTLLQRAVRAGYGIARAAQLTTEELTAAASPIDVSTTRASADASSDTIVAQAMIAVESFDSGGLEAQLRRASTMLPSNAFMEEVIAPLLHEVGERWHEGAISPAHEHLATATVRRVLDWVNAGLDVPAEGGSPTIVIATLPGEAHEIGAMLVARVAAECGWRVRYFGAALPAEHLAAAAQHVRARALAVSIVNTSTEQRDNTLEHLRQLRRALPPSLVLFAGGRGADELSAQLKALGVRVPDGLAGLRAELARHDPRLTQEQGTAGA